MKMKIEGKSCICTEILEGVTYEGIGPNVFTAVKDLERVIERETGKVVALWKQATKIKMKAILEYFNCNSLSLITNKDLLDLKKCKFDLEELEKSKKIA